ncbi:MAG: DNA polymerase III subunit delta, partial [Dehalococcoidia bacterium]
MLYIYYGEDDFSRREALTELEAGLGPPDLLTSNTTLLDGTELTLKHLSAVCNTVPFLAPKRLVIVEGLLSRWGTRERRGRRRQSGEGQASRDLGDWAGASEVVKSMPETTLLVLTDRAVNRQNPLLKLLAPLGQVKEFVPPRGARLHNWIQARVKERGGEISASATKLLADASGGSLWALSAEIEKLCLYTAGSAIDDEDVTRLVAGSRESNIFALVDAVIEGRPARACQELHRLFQAGASASYVISMLGRQFRMIVLATDLSKKGLSVSDIGGRVGLTSEYALGKVLDQAALYDAEDLTVAYEMVLDADLAFKTGELSEG